MLGWLPDLLHSSPRNEFPFGESSTVYIQWGAVLGACLMAAVWDLRSRRIPNALTLPLFLAGVAFNAWVGGITAASLSLGGAAVAALPFVVLYLYAGGGAGDAKLMGAVGAWLGLAQGVAALVTVVIAGAILGLVQAVWQKKFTHITQRMAELSSSWFAMLSAGHRPVITQLDDTQPLQMPYGVSIFTGVALAAVGAMLWSV